MNQCPVCLAHDESAIEQRGSVPVLQNVLLPTQEMAKAFPTGRLDIRFCHACGFVWNAAFDANLIDYGEDYDNSVQASAVYLGHQEAMARRVLSKGGELHYLEIGCGAGEFIEALDRTGRLSSAIGFDPAWTGQCSFGPHVKIWPEYFRSGAADKLPDNINIVCSRHTIEHVPNPRDFVRDIAELVVKNDLTLFLETPDVSWIFAHLAFEDFFYEHCSLFSQQSMSHLLAEFGLHAEITPVYQGQYMWVEARSRSDPREATVDADLARRYQAESGATLAEWKQFIAAQRQRGPVGVWGAASKGVTFSLLLEGIDFAIDLNPAKQGGFMPVSGIPIISPGEAQARGVASLIVMNPNYEAEIREKVRQMGWNVVVANLRNAKSVTHPTAVAGA